VTGAARSASYGGGDIDLYLGEIGRVPLLTKDDEARLAQLIEAGRDASRRLESGVTLPARERRELDRAVAAGAAATRQFVEANLRLVVSIARKYRRSGVAMQDLIQEGNVGLMHAVEKFDWRKGFKFSTYATWWIRQSITRSIANDSRMVRLPQERSGFVAAINVTRDHLTGAYGREPTTAEVASALGVEVERVVDALAYGRDTRSLSSPLGAGDEGAELGDVLVDEGATSPVDAAVAAVLPESVMALLEGLDERARRIIELRFGLGGREPLSLVATAEVLGVTRERVRQIEVRQMQMLRAGRTGKIAADLCRN
jgi:RNA polymerase sigma factor (sigma-70 family)